jgi:hypothetical protein
VHDRGVVFVGAGVDPIDPDVNLGVDTGDLARGVADDRRRRSSEVVDLNRDGDRENVQHR